jgi:hypothetical protein
MYMKKTLGVIEKIKVKGLKEKEVLALVDTGAKLTSIDIKLAAEVGLGPIVRATKIKSASKDMGTRRPVLKAMITVGGREFEAEVNVADRSRMAFPALLGRNIITGNFFVDVEKNRRLFRKVAAEKKALCEFE